MPSLIPANPFRRRLIYEALHLWSAAKGFSAFNIGYAPVDNDIMADPLFARECYQIQLYAELFKLARLVERNEAKGAILEVGIGGGGGLRYLKSLLPQWRMAGIDCAAVAAVLARLRGAEAKVGGADKLPFGDGEFNCVICVDSFSVFPQNEFVKEARRVLRPGGCLVIGDYLVARTEDIRAQVRETVAGGFEMDRFENMTAGVLMALEADNGRKERIIARLPARLKATLAETLSLKGSKRFEDWQAGRMCYYMTVLRRIDDEATNRTS